ncbi:hypothetical protein EGW08_020808, partial [Elysia chlorotica]
MVVSTQMMRMLTDHYGLSGAYLVLGALEMHGIAAALLLRPVAAYRGVTFKSDNLESPEEEVTFITASTSMATSPSENSTGRTGMVDFSAHKPPTGAETVKV